MSQDNQHSCNKEQQENLDASKVVDMIKKANLYDLINLSLKSSGLQDDTVEIFIQRALQHNLDPLLCIIQNASQKQVSPIKKRISSKSPLRKHAHNDENVIYIDHKKVQDVNQKDNQEKQSVLLKQSSKSNKVLRENRQNQFFSTNHALNQIQIDEDDEIFKQHEETRQTIPQPEQPPLSPQQHINTENSVILKSEVDEPQNFQINEFQQVISETPQSKQGPGIFNKVDIQLIKNNIMSPRSTLNNSQSFRVFPFSNLTPIELNQSKRIIDITKIKPIIFKMNRKSQDLRISRSTSTIALTQKQISKSKSRNITNISSRPTTDLSQNRSLIKANNQTMTSQLMSPISKQQICIPDVQKQCISKKNLQQEALKVSIDIKKQKLLNSFSYMNLNILIELGRIKKPNSLVIQTSKLLCALVHLFKDKDIQKEELMNWDQIKNNILQNLIKPYNEIMGQIKQKVFSELFKEDLKEKMKILKAFCLNQDNCNKFKHLASNKSLKVIVEFVFNIISYILDEEDINEEMHKLSIALGLYYQQKSLRKFDQKDQYCLTSRNNIDIKMQATHDIIREKPNELIQTKIIQCNKDKRDLSQKPVIVTQRETITSNKFIIQEMQPYLIKRKNSLMKQRLSTTRSSISPFKQIKQQQPKHNFRPSIAKPSEILQNTTIIQQKQGYQELMLENVKTEEIFQVDKLQSSMQSPSNFNYSLIASNNKWQDILKSNAASIEENLKTISNVNIKIDMNIIEKLKSRRQEKLRQNQNDKDQQ